MRSVKPILISTVSLLFLLLAASFTMLAEGGGQNEAAITDKISTEGLSGLNQWFVTMYNDQRVLFAFVTLVTMGVIGMIIAFIAEYFLKMIGMETTRIDHKE